MPSLDDLYALVRALSPAETEAFRLYAGSQADAVNAEQAALFEALLDEARKGSGHVARMAVAPEVVDGLDEQLHRALRFRAEGEDPADRVRRLMAEHRLLLDKHLYALADRRLDAARDLAAAYERFYDGLEIINLQKTRLARIASLEEAERARRELEAEEAVILERLVNYINYRNAAKEVHEAFRMPERPGPDRKIEWIAALFQRPLLADPKQAKSETARYHFWHLRCTFHYFDGDLPRAWSASTELLELVRRHPFLVEASPEAHAVSWFNHLGLALELGDANAFGALLGEYRAWPDRLPAGLPEARRARLRGTVSVRADFLELKRDLLYARIDEGLARVRQAERNLAASGEREDPFFRAQLPYLFAYFRFLAGELDAAHATIEAILAQADLRDDIRAAVLFMRQLVAFDRGDGPAFREALPHALGFLDHTGRGRSAEADLLRTLGDAVRDGDPVRAGQRLLALRETLRLQAGNPFERDHLPPFDVAAWLEARVTGRSFRDCLGAGEAFRVMR